jgi:hypothetical protein
MSGEASEGGSHSIETHINVFADGVVGSGHHTDLDAEILEMPEFAVSLAQDGSKATPIDILVSGWR